MGGKQEGRHIVVERAWGRGKWKTRGAKEWSRPLGMRVVRVYMI